MLHGLSSAQQIAGAAVGFFLPPLLAVPIQSHWSREAKAAFSVGAYAVAAAVILGVSGSFTGKRWWEVSAITLITGVAGYRGVWQPAGVAPVIETATNRRARRVAVSISTASEANLARIEHIVVVMLENRSFDHMLGYLSLEGGRRDIDGLTTAMAAHDCPHPVHHLDRTALTKPEDPDHSAKATAQQIAGGKMDGFVDSYAAILRKRGVTDGDPELVMGYYNDGDLPTYDFLAANYCVCERWFSSVPGATWPNRLYAVAGRAAGSKDDNPLPPGPVYDLPSFVRHLDEAKVSWRWYSYDPGTLRLIDGRYRLGRYGNFAYVDRRAPNLLTRLADEAFIDDDRGFLDDAAAGTLPAVSWIDPSFVDLHILGQGSNDDHPPSDIHAGQELVLTVYRALAESPAWDKTLLIITYDEHGGFSDHVAPPAAEDDDPAFTHYGVRVPALIVSPRVAPGSVSKTVFDHPSILKTILVRFCQRAGTIPDMGKRVSAAKDLGALLSNPDPRPPADTTQVVAAITTHHLQAAHERLSSPPSPSSTPDRVLELQAGLVEAARELRKLGLPAGRP